MTGTAQTVVLALDGLSFRYLDAFDLPNLDAIRSRGIEAPLRSTHPPWTASAWPSMFTGMGPSNHGVFSFFDFRDCYPDEAPVVSREHVRAPALWEYLSSVGRSVVVLNMPVTHPAGRIEGALVPGYLALEDSPGTPEGIRAEISETLGEPYRIYADTELSDDGEAKLAGYVDLIDLRRRAAEYLLGTYEPDLAIVQVQKTDAVFHNFSERTAFEQVYRAADELVGSVLGVADDDANVIICSDHGMSPNTGYVVHVNQVLADHGLVETTTEGGSPSLGEQKRRWVSGEPAANAGEPDANGDEIPETGVGGVRTGVASRVIVGAEQAFSTVGVSPGDVFTAARRVGLDGTLQRLLPEGTSLGERVDWTNSTAYCRIGSELGVRINLAGREPEGVVPRADYETVRDEVIEVLRTLNTPDGEPAFEFVRPREQVYDGPYTEHAPDVIFRPAGMNHGIVANLVGRRFIPETGHNHDLDGVFVGTGPGFSGAGVEELALPDVAPMVMALLGQEVPARMTGTVPEDVLNVPVRRREYGDVSFGVGPEGPESHGRPESETRPDEGRVRERLEDLGYR